MQTDMLSSGIDLVANIASNTATYYVILFIVSFYVIAKRLGYWQKWNQQLADKLSISPKESSRTISKVGLKIRKEERVQYNQPSCDCPCHSSDIIYCHYCTTKNKYCQDYQKGVKCKE